MNLYEVDEGITYSSNSFESKIKINDKFRVIFAYNNVGAHRKTRLPQTILSRCAILKMEPIDNDIQTIATISLLQLPDKKYKLNNGTETDRITVAAKIGRCHFEMREKHNELTGRSLSLIHI